MPPIVPDPRRIKTFASEAAFETWLAAHHDKWPELWIKIHKKGSGLRSVTPAEAIDVALCWGWIDGLRKGFDERSFLQRYTPRGRKSVWSQINRDNVARLVAAGRMTPHGQRHVDAARADGRWDAAYAPIARTSEATLPPDLRAAIEASPRARRTLRTLDRLNLFALAFRTNAPRTPAGRARKIAALVATLARGEAIVPSASSRKGSRSGSRSRSGSGKGSRSGKGSGSGSGSRSKSRSIPQAERSPGSRRRAAERLRELRAPTPRTARPAASTAS